LKGGGGTGRVPPEEAGRTLALLVPQRRRRSQKVPPGEVEGPGRSLLEELVSFCRIPLPEVLPEEVEEPQGSRPEEGGGTGGPLPFRSWKVPPEEVGGPLPMKGPGRSLLEEGEELWKSPGGGRGTSGVPSEGIGEEFSQ
jgi:hypothetical protein